MNEENAVTPESLGMTRRITAEDIVSVIEASPDRKNPKTAVGGCDYFTEVDCPSCVIGHVMFNVGVKYFDGTSIDCYPELFRDQHDFDLAISVQCHADRGQTWGEALQRAGGLKK